MAKNVATEFNKIINDARERKRNEDLASKIFSKSRRQSAPSKLKATPGASLASRVGVKKQRASIGGAKTPGNVNGEWTHDLHNSISDARSKGKTTALGARITKAGAPAPAAAAAAAPSGPGKRKAKAAAARKVAALERMDIDPVVKEQVTVRSAPPTSQGISIRGLAGPFSVMGQNFAPGTTAADIESAMTPIGGEMESCRIIKTSPIMIVEMVFLSREGGERVIETFNNKTADGRLIKVFPKIGGLSSSSRPATRQTTKNVAEDQIVDGSMGFPEPPRKQTLYSDRMVTNNNSDNGGNSSRRGRGNQRGRGGR